MVLGRFLDSPQHVASILDYIVYWGRRHLPKSSWDQYIWPNRWVSQVTTELPQLLWVFRDELFLSFRALLGGFRFDRAK